MYLSKVEGLGSVSLPDGTIMTRADLLSTTTRCWVASREAFVVRAVGGRVLRVENSRQTTPRGGT
ncbi:MAG: hypothetical protein ACJAZ1_002247 [Yoonia sp.]|jgi:hypothetical protein